MKLLVKFTGLEAYQDIKHYLLKVVHDSMTVEEFEELWNRNITSYDPEENEWLVIDMRNGSDGFLRFSKVISLQECPQLSVLNQ